MKHEQYWMSMHLMFRQDAEVPEITSVNLHKSLDEVLEFLEVRAGKYHQLKKYSAVPRYDMLFEYSGNPSHSSVDGVELPFYYTRHFYIVTRWDATDEVLFSVYPELSS